MTEAPSLANFPADITIEQCLRDAPEWFRNAIAHAPKRETVQVLGTEIETLSWGKIGNPAIVLLHGMGANADWWSFIAPLLADRYRVIAPSWSGMGRSGWRPRYDFDIHVAEAIQAATHASAWTGGKPVFVGHSYGGVQLMMAAHRHGAEMAGAIFLDCYVPRARREGRSEPRPLREGHHIYATLDEAMRNFRFRPEQHCDHEFIRSFVAAHSVHRARHGWTWRTDPNLRASTLRVPIAPYFSSIECPAAFLAGTRSLLITDEARAYMREMGPPHMEWHDIADAGHHVMIDQPLLLVDTLRTILDKWHPR